MDVLLGVSAVLSISESKFFNLKSVPVNAQIPNFTFSCDVELYFETPTVFNKKASREHWSVFQSSS